MESLAGEEGRRLVTIKNEHYDAMAEYHEMTERPINHMIDEYLGDCIDSYLEAALDTLAERTAKA